MAKKKRQDSDNYEDVLQDEEVAAQEEPIEEEEEGDDREAVDELAEDESDLAMLRKLEEDDTIAALSEIVFDEEVGFNPAFDWSSVSEAEKNRFRDLRNMNREDVANYSWKKLNFFQKWMVASACSRVGLHEMFRDIVSGIINTKKTIPELYIEEIYMELIGDYVDTEDYEKALSLVDNFHARFVADKESKNDIIRKENDAHSENKKDKIKPFLSCMMDKRSEAIIRALIALVSTDGKDGRQYIDEIGRLKFSSDIYEHEKDGGSDSDRTSGKIQFEIGYSLLNMGKFDLALEFFEKARQYAQVFNNYELLMEIDNARALTLRAKNGDNYI